MGIEPTALAWEARVLPLYDAREERHFTRGMGRLAICAFCRWVRFWGESLGIDSHRRRFLRFRLVRFHGGIRLSRFAISTIRGRSRVEVTGQGDANLELRAGAVYIGVRTYFSRSYLHGAAMFAREAHAIEARYLETHKHERVNEHLAKVVASVMMSTSSIEAFVNEIFADAAERFPGYVDDMSLAALASLGAAWESDSFERLRTLEKYSELLARCGCAPIDKGGRQYQDVKILLDVRNSLTHMKLRTYGLPENQTKWLIALERDLTSRIRSNPMYGEGNPFFPDRLLGHGFAEWGVITARRFMLRVAGLIGLPKTAITLGEPEYLTRT